MHELAVCQALMEQIECIAREQQAGRVDRIQLGIGPLSGVEPRLLQQAFYIARAGTIAEQAELQIENMAVQVRCNQCNALSEVLPSRLLCGECGDWRTTLISGDELCLQHVELLRNIQEGDGTTLLARSGALN